jgi:hypothetical protein
VLKFRTTKRNFEEKVNTLNVLPTDCDCERCSSMCHAPCCGTPEDFDRLIKAGYAKRLMFDDLPGGPNMLKPALKFFEGERSPWMVLSIEGCTFWKDGRCELHHLGLKPIQGKLAHHSNTDLQIKEIENLIHNSWETKEGEEVIEKWKKFTNFSD